MGNGSSMDASKTIFVEILGKNEKVMYRTVDTLLMTHVDNRHHYACCNYLCKWAVYLAAVNHALN
jgi:hypothetical protein